ncbi:unnamed protein product [Trichobilharzia regenti]|nr:unnamed protein product [Trichobilharzia regenti]
MYNSHPRGSGLILGRHNPIPQLAVSKTSIDERKSDPTEVMQLEGFTVDYCDVQSGMLHNNHFNCSHAQLIIFI